MEDERPPGPDRGIKSTNWTALRQGDVEHLVHAYWSPVHRFLKARLASSETAEDLTQEFFLHFLQKGLLARADPERGRFRGFLFTVARQFLVDHFRERGAARRGGGVAHAGLDAAQGVPAEGADPASEFDRQWFLSLLNRARLALKNHYAVRGRPEVYRAFRLFYFGDEGEDRWSQKRIAEELGEPVSQVNNHIHRARGVYAELVRNLVAEYSTGEEDFQEEMASVARFLEGGKYPGLPDSTAIQPRPGEDELAE
ncbi:MAG: sigma-70 family RNA polymerase sigma factor [Planctomycetes bacterium]|nr:sigma-70 family RNA polymerase sigma factor [Planctomycetota bacterium]